MRRLSDRRNQVDVQILDKEVSSDFKKITVEDWGATYQLVPPNSHRINIDERAIRTFKANVLSVLSGVDPTFPKFMWYSMLVHIELTINLLHQATLNPSILAWEYFNGAFDYT